MAPRFLVLLIWWCYTGLVLVTGTGMYPRYDAILVSWIGLFFGGGAGIAYLGGECGVFDGLVLCKVGMSEWNG